MRPQTPRLHRLAKHAGRVLQLVSLRTAEEKRALLQRARARRQRVRLRESKSSARAAQGAMQAGFHRVPPHRQRFKLVLQLHLSRFGAVQVCGQRRVPALPGGLSRRSASSERRVFSSARRKPQPVRALRREDLRDRRSRSGRGGHALLLGRCVC